jgi:hypothetical protein
MALREIVSDLGADRGVLLCEAGFQSGATEAANLTNVRSTTLEDLTRTASADILAMRLRELYDRTDSCADGKALPACSRYPRLQRQKSVAQRVGIVELLRPASDRKCPSEVTDARIAPCLVASVAHCSYF